ncbi:TolB family protein [Neobacillus terrae]|uniref:TolB family protein n=1 Tax=Neobacillus terrae TaxID=3034837 RepID=UPI00140AAE0E|nr:TolB domain-containing protein [Neobacillus terrae]NHM30106.1 TolB domain-containing protein [Neobacillus terrae]
MRKSFIIIFSLILIFPITSHAEQRSPSIKVAFVRDGYLWIKADNKEIKLSKKKSKYPIPPQWSRDGKMLLYQKETKGLDAVPQYELWVYDFKTNKHQKVFYNAQNPKWSPKENIIAFQSDGVLNVSDLKTFYNIALGVSDYEWQPDGKGFIASSSASLTPLGWTNPVLYTISIAEGYKNITSLSKNVKEFFTIPKEITKGKVTILAINADSFAYSPDHKWISFIVSPTASWSMDSNMLCVISANGKEFQPLDEIILHLDRPQWADNRNLLGYIAGGGRIVFGFKNKKMKVTELPAYQTSTLTPTKFAELGFTWVNDSQVIVSRVKESEWSNDPAKRPEPSLYALDLSGLNQIKITSPPKGKGDYQPQYLPVANKITWIRKSDLTTNGDLLIANPNGHGVKLWVKNIGPYSIFR